MSKPFAMRGAKRFFHASVARMVRQGTANPYYAGSSPVRCSINNFYATLAQLVEHLTCNEDVVSSTLTGGSIFNVSGYSAVWLAHSLWERRVAGSNPAIPTMCPHRLVRLGHRVFIPATGVRISVWMPFCSRITIGLGKNKTYPTRLFLQK